MSDLFTRVKLGQAVDNSCRRRRQPGAARRCPPPREAARRFRQGAAAAGSAAMLPASLGAGEAFAQGAGDTLVIAAPATPQGLDIEFDVSIGSIDSLGALYEYMLAYEKVEDPNVPGVLREDTSVHADKPNNMALKGRLAEAWDVSPDGRNATFKLREGVKSSWGTL